MERYSMFMDRKTQYCQDFSSSQLGLQIKCNLNQNTSNLICEYWQTDSKVYMKDCPGGPEVKVLVWEDSTCHGTTKSSVPQLLSLHSKAHMLQLLKPECQEPMLCHQRSHWNEKPMHRNYSSRHLPQLEKAHVW